MRFPSQLMKPLSFNDRMFAIDAWERFKEMRQGIYTLGEPSKEFERMVFAGELDHGGNPALRWMAGNVVVHFDRNLNFMPDKARSSEKIDGIVALVMCVGLACVDLAKALGCRVIGVPTWFNVSS